MKLLFVLSKEDIKLALNEVISFAKPNKSSLDGNYFLVDSTKKDFNRLAYTRAVFKILFISSKKDLEKDFSKVNWGRKVKGSFALENNVKGLDRRKYAGLVYLSLAKPKVDLKKPDTLISIFPYQDKVVCGVLMQNIKHDFDSRKAHKRPELHPTSLNPKLARACINLTGVKKGVILDPFCGSGGILLEAGMMGLKPVGYDIDRIMVNRARINLEHFHVKNYEVVCKDSLLLNKKYKYIVTDLPYGKNTKQKDLDLLFRGFTKMLERVLQERAVVIFPDFYDYKKLFRKSKLKIVSEFEHYLHRSLSKKIVVVEAL